MVLCAPGEAAEVATGSSRQLDVVRIASITLLDDSDSTGYFTSQVLLGTTSFVAAWWRQEARDSRDNGVRVYTVD